MITINRPAPNETASWFIFIAPSYNGTSPLDRAAPVWGPWVFANGSSDDEGRGSLSVEAPTNWTISPGSDTSISATINSTGAGFRVHAIGIVFSRGANGIFGSRSFNASDGDSDHPFQIASRELFPGGRIPNETRNTTGTLIIAASTEDAQGRLRSFNWSTTTLDFH